MKGHWGSWGLDPRDPCSKNAVPAVGLRYNATCPIGGGHLLPSLPVCVSESRLSLEPAVKLMWALLKGGLRLSAELLLALSNSALLGFIFTACLESEREVRRQMAKGYPACTFAWRLKLRAALGCSLPIYIHCRILSHQTTSFLCTFLLSLLPGELHPTGSEQVVGSKSPCQTSCA